MPSQTLDKFTVDLELNTSKLEPGIKKVDESFGKIDKSQNKLNKGFKEVAKGAAEFMVLLGGSAAIRSFTEMMIQTGAAMERFSLNIGENISQVSSWSNAARMAGGSAEGLQATLDMLSRSQTEFQLTGNAGIIPYLNTLGLSLLDANNKAVPVIDLLNSILSRLGQLDRPTGHNLGRMMGLDEGTILMAFNKSRKELEDLIKAQKDYMAITKRQGEESLKLDLIMRRNELTWESLGRSISSDAFPAIKNIFNSLKLLGQWAHENKDFIEDFLEILGATLGVIALKAMPINLTVIAVGLLIGSLALLWDDYQKWKSGGQSFIGDWWGKGINSISEHLDNLSFIALHTANAMNAVFSADWETAGKEAGMAMEGRHKFIRERKESLLQKVPPIIISTSQGAPNLDQLLTHGEGGYNSVNLGKAGKYRASTRDLSSMTIDEVLSAQSRHEFGAAGHYQIVHDTLTWAKKSLGLKGTEKYDPKMQDYIFNNFLIGDKQPMVRDFLNGKSNDYIGALLGLSKEWAMFPSPYTGKSYHDGKGNNKSNVSLQESMEALLMARYARGGGSVNVNIGDINVNTHSNSGKEMAHDIKNELDYLLTTQANYGLR